VTPDDVITILMGSIIHKLIRHAKTFESPKITCVVDEAANLKLIDVMESKALSQTLKWGLRFEILVQTAIWPTEEIGQNIDQNIHDVQYFQQGDVITAERAADVISTRLYDPNHIKLYDERIRVIEEGLEPIEGHSESVSKDHEGLERITRGKTISY